METEERKISEEPLESQEERKTDEEIEKEKSAECIEVILLLYTTICKRWTCDIIIKAPKM